MEDSKSTDEEDHFHDASDEFPFYDCHETSESEYPPSHSSSEPKLIDFNPKSPPETPSSAGLRRRRSFSHRNLSGKRNDISPDSSSGSSLDHTISRSNNEGTPNSIDRKRKFSKGFKQTERLGVESSSVMDSVSAGKRELEDSTVTSTGNDRVEDSDAVDSSLLRENEGDDYDSLGFLVNLIIKAIGFQFNLLISFITFPMWLLYSSYMFAINPFQTVKRGREYLAAKLLGFCNVVLDAFSPYLSKWLRENKTWLELGLRCGWGLLWSVYVCIVLFSLLVSAFVVGGLMMRSLVEEPFRLKQGLNFDYTKSSPVAFVPIIGCPGVHSVGKFEVGRVGSGRAIPPNHKLQATVELTLPESDYNRNLGMFQVRVEFVSSNGETLASSSHPCMLQFKSEPIRLLATFFKVVPLVAGYVSESQSLKLPFRGFVEGNVPTACMKVLIEQRAEFRPGAGIPELYDAFLLLESELPFLKRILWNWKTTIYVWLSMMVFMVEMLFALVCCRSVLFPRVRLRGASGGNNALQSTHPVQR
ncbi:hypothetical protein Ancab_005508 [Ancistrocladus abbreviatus]